MSFRSDNTEFEQWLRTQCSVVDADLEYKHERMKRNAFVFLRATFFRWARRIEKVCPELKHVPPVLSVGDTHTENFGTWRDFEGRLVWGINDFDEAAIIPYAFDLVRLATSVRLAPKPDISNPHAAEAIINGYRTGLANPRPTLLDEDQTWMRPYVACTDDERSNFWNEVRDYPDAKPPTDVAEALMHSLPAGAYLLRFALRVKGGGSLGRPRYIAVAKWRGGQIVREAKALVPSAWDWAHGELHSRPRFLDLATGIFRSPDPFLTIKGRFVLRRIAADSRKVELGTDQGKKLRDDFLTAMGFDVGAIHAAQPDIVGPITRDLAARPANWLDAAAKTAASAVEEDFAEWSN
jgi:hypothetical protein